MMKSLCIIPVHVIHEAPVAVARGSRGTASRAARRRASCVLSRWRIPCWTLHHQAITEGASSFCSEGTQGQSCGEPHSGFNHSAELIVL